MSRAIQSGAVGWQLIECIDPARKPSIVWKDGEPREWTSLAQLSRKDGLEAVLVDRIIAAAVAAEPAPFEERERSPLIDTVVDTRHGSRSLIVHQAVDPTDTVRGLLLWLGEPGEPPQPRPRAAGMLWSGQVLNSMDTYMLRASDLSSYGQFSRADQFFNRVVRFPDLAHVVDMVNASASDNVQPLLSKVTLLHDDQRLVNLQIVARRCDRTVAGIGLDITTWEEPALDPATVARLQEATPTGSSVAVLSFPPGRRRRMPSVVYWVTPPPPWMAYWAKSGPDSAPDLICPDDLDDLRAAFDQLLEGENPTQVVGLRIRARTGEWRPLSVTLGKYPYAEDRLCVMTADFE